MSDLIPLRQLDVGALPDTALAEEQRGYRAIAAKTDVEAIRAWLAMAVSSRSTFESYRKEAERLLLWANVEAKKSLAELRHEDFLRFQFFLADPQPAERWVSQGGRKYGRSDPHWRPFYGPLSPTSQRHTLVVINSMMNWLVAAGYLQGNPLALSQKRRPPATRRITRYLTPAMWDDVKAYVASMPTDTPPQARVAARARWVVSVLYLLGLRISELTHTAMCDFHHEMDRQGQPRWWLSVLGKGGKRREIPASEELMAELGRYRLAQGLAALPHPAETTPLLLPLRHRETAQLTRSAAHTLVKDIFQGAASRLRALSPDEAYRAAILDQASAHWLRHTAGSHMADNEVDLRVVRDNFGHSSLTTTSGYLHTDDVRRHEETSSKHRMRWD